MGGLEGFWVDFWMGMLKIGRVRRDRSVVRRVNRERKRAGSTGTLVGVRSVKEKLIDR